MNRITSMAAITMMLIAGRAAHCGKIDRTRDAVQGTSESESDSDTESRNDDDDDDDSIISVFFDALFDRDHHSGGESNGPSSYVRRETAFIGYPYQNRHPGVAVITKKFFSATHQLKSSRQNPENSDPYMGKRYLGIWQADYNYDWNTVHLTTVRARFVSDFVLGLDLKWTGMFEPLENGTTDVAHMGELGVTFNRAFAPNFLGRYGFGFNLMAFTGNDPDVALGGTVLLGFDYFPVRPMVFSGEFQIGYLNQSLYIRGDVTIGVMLNGPLEVNVGYRGQSFANVHSDDKVRYHGLTAGLRLWF